MVDGLKVLIEDTNTKAIALVGEVGGDAEYEAADLIAQYRAQSKNPK